MNVSYAWLRALAPAITESPQVLAERLAMYGAPVDELVPLAAGLEGVIIARVASTRPHPNADRLRLCEVDAGTGELLQVVCGAPNVQPGGWYPFAPVGATLPGGVEIRQAKIRGEPSQGMLCSERELGLGRVHEGLMELHGEFAAGASFIDAVGLADVRLVVDVTANRGDLLSHVGVARELAPDGRVALPAFPSANGVVALPAPTRAERSGAVAGARIEIEDAVGCPRYVATIIRGVKVGPSPAWLATRLRAIGLRPINNVVDATNYVLHELGQPLHAFDLRKLAGPAIVVRRARSGESLLTLDGETRKLAPDMLVIADAQRPCAIAGVMGGRDSEVDDATTDLLLECAHFSPADIRSTRRALGMSTDASYRFERGVDPAATAEASQRCVELILALAGGAVDGAPLDVVAADWTAPVLALRAARVAQVLGREFAAAEIAATLTPIGFAVTERSPGVHAVRVPGFRAFDVQREIDVVEEVARRFGYEQFAEEPRPFRATVVPDDPMFRLEDRLRDFFVGRGFAEARSLTFAPDPEGDVALLNPLSFAESRLRHALLPGLIHRVEVNFARLGGNVRLFEIGTVFGAGPAGEPPIERTHLAAVLTGARDPEHWSGKGATVDVWDLKGLLEDVCAELGLGADALSADDAPGNLYLAAGTTFRVTRGSVALGRGGRIDDSRIDAPAWAEPVFALELTLDGALAEPRVQKLTPLPSFPAVERDLALLVPAGRPAAEVERAIAAAAGSLLESVGPFDLYEGKGIPAGTRSVAFRLRFRAPDRTLTDREVDKAVERVLRRLREELGVERRA